MLSLKLFSSYKLNPALDYGVQRWLLCGRACGGFRLLSSITANFIESRERCSKSNSQLIFVGSIVSQLAIDEFRRRFPDVADFFADGRISGHAESMRANLEFRIRLIFSSSWLKVWSGLNFLVLSMEFYCYEAQSIFLIKHIVKVNVQDFALSRSAKFYFVPWNSNPTIILLAVIPLTCRERGKIRNKRKKMMINGQNLPITSSDWRSESQLGFKNLIFRKWTNK
ncbi:hypothetical protein M9H77_01284 [Catharanthus roseus]|uniref:Uncharacterized protein n=1 Tax=Catharanthus roseus TaxID=4058 RepID=A0ACC0C5B1_CATRO|nr:hypothetical protein M9H77_01284 [Catharanthus roseus]